MLKSERIKAIFTLPYLPLWLTPLVLLAPVLVRGQALYWGTPYLQFAPWRAWAWEMLHSGQLPLWNPLVGMGAPLLANYQSALIYPPNWLLFLLAAGGGPAWQAWGQTLLVIAHLAWSGVGMARLGRQLGLDPLAQTVSGLAYGMSGYLVARAGFLSINSAAAWLPWILLTGLRLALAARADSGGGWGRLLRRSLPLAVCLAFQLLAGHAQTAYYTLLLLTAWICFWAWRAGRWQGAGKALAGLALAVGLASALAAVQLFPTAEYLLQSQRASSVDFDYAMNYSFFPLRFLTLVAPNLFGSPAQSGYLLNADNYWEDAVYIGLLPLLLAVKAIFASLSSKKAGQAQTAAADPGLSRFLGIWVLLAFLLALGKNSPVFPFFYRYVPTFNMFQAPARFTLWAEIGLALLAGIGASGWQRAVGRGRGWVKRGIAAAAAVVLAAGLALVILGDIQAAFIQATAIAGIAGIGAGFMALTAPDGVKVPRGWQAGVAALISLDLLVAGWGLNPGAAFDLFSQPAGNLAQVKTLASGHRLYLEPSSEQTLKFDRFFSLNNFKSNEDWQALRRVYLPDSAMLDDLASANNFDPLVPGRYASWMVALEKAQPDSRANLLSLMDVGLVERVDPTSADGVQFQTNPGAARLRWAACAQIAATPQAALSQVLARAGSGGAALTGWVVLEGGQPPSPASCEPQAPAALQMHLDQPGRFQIEVKANQPGWLVLADTWYPGWVAMVDGAEVTVTPADYVFRAVPVEAGTHQVEFVYRPLSFYLGCGLTVLGLIFLQLLISFLPGK